MDVCRCHLVSENYASLSELVLVLSIQDMKITRDGKKGVPDRVELFLVDLDSVELKDWLDRRRDEGWGAVPYLCLSSETGEARQISAFQAGAADILDIRQPPSLIRRRIINLLRILPRQSALLNRTHKSYILPGGALILVNRESREIHRNGEELHLTPREWEIFYLLMEQVNRVVSRDSILDTIQQEESFEGTDRMVDSHIKNLRKKLGDKRAIETERGYGYKLRVLQA